MNGGISDIFGDYTDLLELLVKLERNQWFFHLSQHTLPVICDCVRFSYFRQELKISLAHVELKFTNLRLGSSHSKDALRLNVRLL